MKDFETEFAELVSKLKLDDRPDEKHAEDVRRQMLDEFNAKDDTATDGLHKIWRTIMESKYTKIAVAAVVIVAIFFGIGILVGSNEVEPAIVKDVPAVDKGVVENEPSVVDVQKERLATEMKLAGEYFANADVEGLMRLLDTGQLESKVLAANYLADLGADEAFEAIKLLADKWKGEGGNPFSAAEKSLRKIIEEKQAEKAAAKQQPDEAIEPEEDESSAENGELRVYKEIANAYIEQTNVMSDGSKETSKLWIRMPDHIREESTGRMIVDNGKKRLTLNRNTKEAQFSESQITERPLEDNYLIQNLSKMFREKTDDLEFEETGQEDDGRTVVFSLKLNSGHAGGTQFTGTAWVERESMLPIEIEVHPAGEPQHPEGMDPNTPLLTGSVIICNYNAIGDSVFAMSIPVGYKELATKKPGTLSGHVVDDLGNPMVGAKVHVKNSQYVSRKDTKVKDVLTGVADANGYFQISLPVTVEALWSPVVMWATLDDEPGFVAWTMLRSKRDEERALDDEIPGSVGEVIVNEKYGEDVAEKESYTAWCAGASGIVLVMEPAGQIFGRIVDGYGEPIEGAFVDVEPEPVDKYGNNMHLNDRMWRSGAETDKDGYYEVGYLPRLWEKSYFRMRVRADGHTGTEKYWSIEKPLEAKEVDLTLHESIATVRGKLVDNYGTALAERRVMARVDGKDHYNTCVTRTDEDGKFELKGCPFVEGLQIKAQLSHNSMAPHEKEKHENYVYYPDVIVDVDCVEGNLEYEVEMTAVLPELVIDIEIVDSAGEPIPYFPVEVRASESISSSWKSERELTKRSDEQGKLRLTGVPDVEGLKLVFWGGNGTWGDLKLKGEEKAFIEQVKKDYGQYEWKEISVDVVAGSKEYTVQVVILTREEYKQWKRQGN